jgi:hypothetical protein
VRKHPQTSSVTMKICTIDEAASEAVAAWECMGKKPIDETNYEKSRNHVLHSNRASERNQRQDATWGGGRSPWPKNLVCGGVDNPRSSSKWDRRHRRSPCKPVVQDEGKTQQGWAMCENFHAWKALKPFAKQARADHLVNQKHEISALYLG